MFRVNIQNKFSSIAKFDCGIQQGPIFGPLLFLVDVNYMNQAVDCELFRYVFDSCSVYSTKVLKKLRKV